MVYDNLGVTDQTAGYGNLKTNERYLTAYIDDAIARSDIYIAELLLTNKQDLLMSESITETLLTATISAPYIIDNKWFIMGVEYYTSPAGKKRRAIQVELEQLYRLSDNSASLFDATYTTGYYSIHDGNLYLIPFETVGGNNAILKYVDLTHPDVLSTLQSPAGFEGAIADLATSILLMKRNDNPAQSQFHMNLFKEFMSNHLPPSANFPEPVND